MARSLVIVESPAKAKTINKYLGRNYTVKASYGHVMDLPRKELGINIKRGFEPTYEISPDKTHVVEGLRKAAQKAEAVYLAADPDREGEAICAHLAEVLKPTMAAKNGSSGAGKKKKRKPRKGQEEAELRRNHIFRVMFNEITPRAIRAAFEHPGEINENLVDAQQARRVLDRLVGYKISPLLWDKVRRGLSAGRVQTVALRLIVDRESEIRAFNPVEYWTLHALLAAGEPPVFEAKLTKFKGEEIEVHAQAEADAIVAATRSAPWKVASVTEKEKRRFAPPPFTTSKLQQAAYNRLRYTAKRTMGLAQRLYEGVELGQEGSVALITYMRTDSVNVSQDALAQVRELIPERFGSNYLPEKPNYYKSKKDAQEAHEAVRPTDAMRAPEDVRKYLDEDLFKLYQLIWQRFVASQMLPAIVDQTTIDISAGDYTFRATGSVQKFDGYLRVYQMPASIADREDDEKDDEAKAALFPRLRKGKRSAWTRFAPTSTSPNRRRGITMRRWSKNSKKTASGGPRLTLRSFQRLSSVNTLPRTRDVSRPRCSASASACCWSRASKTFSTSPLPRGSKRNSTKSKKASFTGAKPLRSSGKNSSLTSTRLTTRCFLTRPAFPRGKNAKSAARANCWSASAATASSLAVRAIPNAISFKTCPLRLRRRPAANPKPSIATIAGRRWPSSAGASALFSLAPVTRTAEPRGAQSRARASHISRM